MITAIICLSILTIVLLYVTINLLRKCESQEEYFEILQANYDSLSQKAKKVNEIITKADVRGSFEADDEIGEAFKTVKSAVKELN